MTPEQLLLLKKILIDILDSMPCGPHRYIRLRKELDKAIPGGWHFDERDN